MIGYFEFKSSCSYDDQSINQSLSRSVRRSSGQSVIQAVSLSVRLFVWLSVVHQSARLISWLSVRLLVSHAVRRSVSQPAGRSDSQCICLSTCVSVTVKYLLLTLNSICCMFVCLPSVRLSVSSESLTVKKKLDHWIMQFIRVFIGLAIMVDGQLNHSLQIW